MAKVSTSRAGPRATPGAETAKRSPRAVAVAARKGRPRLRTHGALPGKPFAGLAQLAAGGGGRAHNGRGETEPKGARGPVVVDFGAEGELGRAVEEVGGVAALVDVARGGGVRVGVVVDR
jgi:hypothetical protein